MSKRTTFTTISPLPHGITRDIVVEFLHNHQEMIDLNPLVKERHCIKPPAHATPEEFHCTWYSLTDRISYLPGGLANGDVTYTCAFHDLPNGIQTHCYAPAGLNIRDKWTINGSLPGEPIEPVELGLGAPITGLYIREDVDMKCNIVMTNFVKKTLKKSHAALIERLKVKAQIVAAAEANERLASGLSPSSSSASVRSDLSSHPWTPASSASSSPPSVQSFVPQLRSNNNTPPQIPPPYQSPPSTGPSSGFSSPHAQYTLSSPPISRPQSCASYGPNSQPYQNQPRYNSIPSPPQHQQHSSPPAYGRYDSAPQQQRAQPMYQYLPAQQQNPDRSSVPEPLRLRQTSTRSTSSAASVVPTPNSLYRDAHARVTWAAIKAQPSVRYRVAHPDYPQMNPYAADLDRQVPCQGPVRAAHGVGLGHVAVHKVEATLQGPFVAELEG